MQALGLLHERLCRLQFEEAEAAWPHRDEVRTSLGSSGRGLCLRASQLLMLGRGPGLALAWATSLLTPQGQRGTRGLRESQADSLSLISSRLVSHPFCSCEDELSIWAGTSWPPVMNGKETVVAVMWLCEQAGRPLFPQVKMKT